MEAEHDEYIKDLYEPHPGAKQPNDLNSSVLRYMEMNRFTGILDSRKLYLCRCDRFSDKSEGTYSQAQIEDGDEFLRQCNANNLILSEKQRRERLPSTFYANCWCMDRDDTDLMWKAYVPSGDGVAIKSSFANLQRVVLNLNAIELWPLDVTVVTYIDREKDQIPNFDDFAAVAHKDHFFKDENEVRIIHSPNCSGKGKPGVEIPVDLNVLIDAVILAPGAPDERREEVRELLNEAGLSHIPLEPSRYDKLVRG